MQLGAPQPSVWAPFEQASAGLRLRLGLNTPAVRGQQAAAPGAKGRAAAPHGRAQLLALRRQVERQPAGPRPVGVFVLLVFACLVLFRLDTWQLVPLVALTFLYVLVQEYTRLKPDRGRSSSGLGQARGAASALPPAASPTRRQTRSYSEDTGRGNSSPTASRDLYRVGATKSESKAPVVAPSFVAQGLDGQVLELLEQITPTSTSDKAAQKLAERARAAIQVVFPDVEVLGIASGDVIRGTAFGVAVPELDIVAIASPHVLVQHLQSRLTKGGPSIAKLDARKLQKSAIRVCTDQLVSVGGFKFRRSAFRGHEPKVTLMATPPLASGDFDKNIPVDFSVNCVTPLYNAALVSECANMDARARGLILVVRRWAKDRGICHAAKGHLPPYAWTLLAVYFLQVGFRDGPLLPPLRGFRMVNNRMVVRRTDEDTRWQPLGGSLSPEALVVSTLFRAFVSFYMEMEILTEHISVRQGKRTKVASSSASAAASVSRRSDMVKAEEPRDTVGSKAEAGVPNIEDPFEPARNLGSCMSCMGIQRLKEELVRASDILQRPGSLSALLEPWTPSEREEDAEGAEEGE